MRPFPTYPDGDSVSFSFFFKLRPYGENIQVFQAILMGLQP